MNEQDQEASKKLYATASMALLGLAVYVEKSENADDYFCLYIGKLNSRTSFGPLFKAKISRLLILDNTFDLHGWVLKVNQKRESVLLSINSEAAKKTDTDQNFRSTVYYRGKHVADMSWDELVEALIEIQRDYKSSMVTMQTRIEKLL
jgi:hypothetical protein